MRLRRELSKPGETVHAEGVTILAPLNLPASMPYHRAAAARAVKARFTFLGLLAGCDWEQRPLFLLDYARNDRFELLTDRERQVYQLLAEGNSNKEIANLLGLSLHTVETHRSRIMEKLNVHSTAELVLSAVRRGLVT